MLPPRKLWKPPAAIIRWIMVVAVDLPLEPVTAITGADVNLPATSTSLNTGSPRARKEVTRGWVSGMPGLSTRT
ncbi:hypothetical protein ES703_118225 [subsurface metagenome]